jgi:hypothetical protein
VHIDKEGIKAFLDTLSYPLYFLDFESMQVVVPEFPKIRPINICSSNIRSIILKAKGAN